MREPEPAAPVSEKPGELTVFITRREGNCVECGENMSSGDYIRVQKNGILCLDCADLGHLEFLMRGDVALTRRATKYSSLRAIVLKWSRARKRYERQGILVEPEAIERAEIDCAVDADEREARQEKQRKRREEQDKEFIRTFAQKIRQQYPGSPREVADSIADHACRKYSGRVGRSAAAKAFAPDAITLAVQAHIRHCYTKYDALLMKGVPRREAREEVRPKIDEILDQWSKRS